MANFGDLINNLIANILDIFGKHDLNAAKKRELKTVFKKIKRSKPLILNTVNNELTQSFCNLLYEINEFITPLKHIFDFDKEGNIRDSLISFFFEQHLTSHQQSYVNDLSEHKLESIFYNDLTSEAYDKCMNIYENYVISFSQSDIHFRNRLFNSLICFNELVKYDLYPIIKKFAPAFEVNNKQFEKPYIHPLKAVYVIDELKVLNDIINSVNLEPNLSIPLNIYLRFKNISAIEDAKIRKLQQRLEIIKKENYLDLIIMWIDQNPHYKPINYNKQIDGMSLYFKLIEKRINNIYLQMQVIRKKEALEEYLKELFHKIDIETLEHYNNIDNNRFKKYNLKEYKYVDILEYVKYFFQTEYQEMSLNVLKNLSIQTIFAEQKNQEKYIDIYNKFKNVIKNILELEDDLSNNGNTGSRINELIKEHEEYIKLNEDENTSSALDIINDYIDQQNDKVKKTLLLFEYSTRMIGMILKEILKDIKNKDKTYIRNLKVLKLHEEISTEEAITYTFNSMKYMNKLLREFIEPSSGEKV